MPSGLLPSFERTFRRYRHRGVVDEVERAKNRTKSKVRAKLEHPIGVIKRVFGFAKVRYRGLQKNLHRLLVTALANLYTARRQLLPVAEASCTHADVVRLHRPSHPALDAAVRPHSHPLSGPAADRGHPMLPARPITGYSDVP